MTRTACGLYSFGMCRITRLVSVGMVAAALLAGCSPSRIGQSGITQPAALAASCPTSPMGSHGFGTGPAYLSGQSSWYSGGQTAVLMVDSKYSGPLLVHASPFGSAGASRITLADLDLDATASAGLAAKERNNSVAVVPAIHAPGGGMELQAAPSSSLWRAWFGRLSTNGPGCFALHVDGNGFTEVIVLAVLAGPAPPG